MKFFVYRTSGESWAYNPVKPCAEAELYKDDKSLIALWTVEITTIDELIEFCDKYGEVVVMPKDKSDPYPTIEIYDDYRE